MGPIRTALASCSFYHPRRRVGHCPFIHTIFLRLAEGQQPLFPNLQKLNVDMNFAADTSILLFLASALLDDVTIEFPAYTEVVTVSTSVAESFVHSLFPAYQAEETILGLQEQYAPSHQLLQSS